MAIIRSISGLRATLGDSLTPSLAVQYAAAFADTLNGDIVVIGRDGRPSGLWMEKLIIATLNAKGKKVLNLGLTPTPMVQLYTEHTEASGGIAITASHNPKIWNGMKFINHTGVFLNKEENEKLWDILDNEKYSFGFLDEYPEFDEQINMNLHKDLLFQNPLFTAETVEKIKKCKLKICVDAVNASGSYIVPELLRSLDCEVVEIACKGNGIFPHTPEPIPENLTSLKEAVIEHKADLGIAVDPDADRLVLADGNGVLIGEERTITLAVECVLANYDLLKDKFSNAITVNLSTTRAVEDVAIKYGAEIFRSPVGEINVVSEMKRTNSVIGGEGSGGVIFPAYHYGRDSIVGIALILKLIADRGLTLAELNQQLPQYEMNKQKLPIDGDINAVFAKAAKRYPNARKSTADGLRLDTEDSWIHIRASNTEPIMRIITENPIGKKAMSVD